MLNIIKDEFYYKKINAETFIKSINSSYYIDLAMVSTHFAIIRDEEQNFITLTNQYNSIQFTFSNNLKSKDNTIVDIRENTIINTKEIENVLKKSVHEKIKDMADRPKDIIFSKYEIDEKNKYEVYTVIVKLCFSCRYRIYQGMLHSTEKVGIKYMTIEKDLLDAMLTKEA